MDSIDQLFVLLEQRGWIREPGGVAKGDRRLVRNNGP
jgi:hypothetical protein